jgi:hypothetical protein
MSIFGVLFGGISSESLGLGAIVYFYHCCYKNGGSPTFLESLRTIAGGEFSGFFTVFLIAYLVGFLGSSAYQEIFNLLGAFPLLYGISKVTIVVVLQ